MSRMLGPSARPPPYSVGLVGRSTTYRSDRCLEEDGWMGRAEGSKRLLVAGAYPVREIRAPLQSEDTTGPSGPGLSCDLI